VDTSCVRAREATGRGESPRKSATFLDRPGKFRETERGGTHRTREPRGEELGLGGEAGELRDVASKRASWEVVLQHLWGSRRLARCQRAHRRGRREDGALAFENGDTDWKSHDSSKLEAKKKLACMQCGSFSTCRMISCPASSNPRSRPPMPEKSETVFMVTRRFYVSRSGAERCDAPVKRTKYFRGKMR